MNKLVKRFITNALLIFYVIQVQAQNEASDYWLNNGFTNNETVYTNTGTFYDDGGFGLYNPGQAWTVRFCSENGNPITVDFNGFHTDYRGVHPDGDDYDEFDYILIDYTGMDQLVAYGFDTPQFSFTSPDGCISFAFTSQQAGESQPKDGWSGEISANPPPVNNDPCDAIELNVGNVCSPSFYTNKGAWDTRNIGAPACHDFYGGDVWFKARVPENGDLTVETYAGSLVYGILSLYTGSCDGLVEYECVDIEGTMPVYTFNGLTPGEMVYLRLFGNRAQSGTFGICARDPNAVIQGYTGPGGVGDSVSNRLWVRADEGTESAAGTETSEGESVQTWRDQSGNENDLTQMVSGSQPEFVTDGIGVFPSLVFDGASSALQTSTDLNSGPYTFYTVHEFSSDKEHTLLSLGQESDENSLSISRENSTNLYYTFSGTAHKGQVLPSSPQILNATHNIRAPYHTYRLNNNSQLVNYSGGQVSTDGELVVGADRNNGNFMEGRISEILLYSKNLNLAQNIIVSNYLAAKYKIDIANDYYPWEDTHFYDLAGIGRIDGQNFHSKAQSAGILSIGGAGGLDDDEFVLFAHDNGEFATWTANELPAGSDDMLRLEREWKVAVRGDGSGTVSVGLDSLMLPELPVGYSGYNLLVDEDGDFSSEALAYGLVPNGSEIIANDVELLDGWYISVAAVKTLVNFSESESSGPESLERPVILVQLNYAISEPVRVAYSVTDGTATGDGVDYSLNDDELIFNPGEKEKEILPMIFEDSLVEIPDEFFTISLEVVGGNVLKGETTDHRYTILDNDAILRITASDSLVGECEESDVTLNAELRGKEIVSFAWSPAESLENPASLSTVAKPATDTWYVFSGTDDEGTVYTDSVQIRVIPVPEKPLISFPGTGQFCEGDSMLLSAPDGYTYLWSNGETDRELMVNEAGKYSVMVSDSRCFSDPSDSVELEVLPRPATPEIILTGSVDICEGESVSLAGPEGYSYLWSNEETEREITVSQSGNYSLVVNNGQCSSDTSESIEVSVYPVPEKPLVTLIGEDEFCPGESSILSGPDGFFYEWSNGDTSQNIVVREEGDYTLIVSNPGCSSTASEITSINFLDAPEKPEIMYTGDTDLCEGESLSLTVPEAVSYEWSNGEREQTIEVEDSGYYAVRVFNEKCGSPFSDSVLILVHPIPEVPVISPQGPVTLPSGSVITLSSSEADGYLWSNGESSKDIIVETEGSYAVKAVSEFECSSDFSDSVEVILSSFLAAPEISIDGDTVFCRGGEVSLSGPDGFSYIWSTGDTTQSIVVDETGVFSLKVQNAEGIMSMSSAPIGVRVNENPGIYAVTEDVSCFGGNDGRIELSISGGSRPYSVEWDTGSQDTLLTGLTAGTYTGYVEDANACRTMLQVDVSQAEEIAIEATIVPARCSDASDGSLELSVSGGTDPYFYEWDDGSLGDFIHNLSAGTYRVTVTDQNNCEKSESFEVPNRLDVCFDIPDIITPNGDGRNDEWILEGIEVFPGVTVEIFDRRGKRVFYSKGYDTPFRGEFNGVDLPMESYHYFIDLKNGTPVIVGNITIVR